MPDQLKVSERYQGERGQHYLANRLSSPPTALGYRLSLEFFLPYLKPTDTVLDFGAGNGGILNLLKDHVARAEGLEVNPAAAQVARRASGCPVALTIGDLPDNTFDAIITNHVLEHVRDVCSTLELLRAKLKPGGLFIVKVPINDAAERRQRTWDRDDRDHHLQTWTPRLFANVFFESGYEVREVRVITSAWHPRLFPLRRIGLGKPAFWLFSILKHRRELLAVGQRPPERS